MKKTIFETLTGNKVSNGLVEIINVHGGTYFMVALDGVVMNLNYDFEAATLDNKFIKQCCKALKLEENDLTFVRIDWYDFAQCNSDFYDANDFSKYQDFIDFLDNNPTQFQTYQIQNYSKNFDDTYSL